MKKCIPLLFILISTWLVGNQEVNGLAGNQEIGSWQPLSTPKNFKAFEVTPWALYGGEFNSNWDSNPYNGVFVSYDLGETWQESGLANRGIFDLALDQAGNLYATVYYNSSSGEPGLYKSSNRGTDWVHIGPDHGAVSIASCNNNLVLGTGAHGLWTSEDGGTTWKQQLSRIGAYADTKIVRVKDDILVASDYWNTYISYDCGSTWAPSPVLPRKLSSITAANNVWLACSDTFMLSRSRDNGAFFNQVLEWNGRLCLSTAYYNGQFYISSQDKQTGRFIILSSADQGTTWHEVSPAAGFTDYILQLTPLAADPGFIFAHSPLAGLHRYKVRPYTPEINSFLANLWDRKSMDDQTDTITSYFDHSYPFLAYPYQTEPQSEADTTLNFWGDREKEPQLYYSSHDGTDFGLRYGTPILAPAAGYASYSYTAGGGHTIKIDHQNGYQTQYLHFQKKGLFTDKPEAKWIDQGQQVGLIGMTGNTTGPHLHFGVRYDKNGNGNFTDDVPDGRVDPYAWYNEHEPDAWPAFYWTDRLGEHAGTVSAYLWNDLLGLSTAYFGAEGGELTHGNATVEVPPTALDKPITLKAQKTAQSNTLFANTTLKYIQGTAIKLTGYDHLGETAASFTQLIDLSFDLTQAKLQNVITSTLKIYFFNHQTQLWEEIASLWDETTKTVKGFVDHLSEFAVFGEKVDSNPPHTSITISGTQDGLWFIKEPMMELLAPTGRLTFYSIDGGASWEEYVAPTQISKEGVFAVLYRSVDDAENYELTQNSPLLRVNTAGKFRSEVKLSAGTFTISD
ncbi:peptidoglycan DD-metalloendopeptidase family protein [Patescibacteria group bacterium]|nr:peptidoglycan DD-metalloendopeptidase family protein [Patescibacteria group bacterium]